MPQTLAQKINAPAATLDYVIQGDFVIANVDLALSQVPRAPRRGDQGA